MVKPWSAGWAAAERPVLKLKIEEFVEGPGAPPPPPPKGAPAEALEGFVFALATDRNRLAAAGSKVGSAADCARWPAIAAEAARDSLDDVGLGTDHPLYDRLTAAAYDVLADEWG